MLGKEHPEAREVGVRYARRSNDDRYSPRRPEVYLALQERQRCVLRLIRRYCRHDDFSVIKVIEVGCGTGSNLLEFLQFGIQPENLCGIELIPERSDKARRRLPSSVMIHDGDAMNVSIPVESVDIAFQSLVFSSLLDDGYQRDLARQIWSWIKPTGGLLWYDFTYDNPANADVRGVTKARIHALFPDASISSRRVTLAPPISRRVCRIHEAAYGVFNVFPFLRTHLLCWIAKR